MGRTAHLRARESHYSGLRWPASSSSIPARARAPRLPRSSRRGRAAGVPTHLLRAGEDAAELARAADADVLGMAGGDGSLARSRRGCARARPAIRLHPVRDAQPFRPRPRPRPRRPDRGATGVRRPASGASTSAAQTSGLPEQRVARRLREARPPARRRIAAAATRLRDSARGRSWSRTGIRSASRSTANRSRAGSCSSRTMRTSSSCLRSASRERLDEGKLYLYCPGRRSGRSAAARPSASTPPSMRCRRRSTASPRFCETPIEFTIEPGALRVLVPPG